MNGRHPYTQDYKSICNPQLYPYIQHFDRTCIFQAHIHQCLYCSRKKPNLYKMGNTCKTLISSVVVVFNQSRLQIESVGRVPPICTNSWINICEQNKDRCIFFMKLFILVIIRNENTNLCSFSRLQYTLGYIYRYSCPLCCYTWHLDDTHWKRNTHLYLKKPFLDNHKCPIHILAYCENDTKEIIITIWTTWTWMAVPCIPLITRTSVASDCIHTCSISVASVFSQCAFINVFILWKEKMS